MRHETYQKTPRFTDADHPPHLVQPVRCIIGRLPMRVQMKFDVSGADCLRYFPFRPIHAEIFLRPVYHHPFFITVG